MDIYWASKVGDLDRIRFLCEVEDVDLNKKNEFDSIPLFYACLCGHKDVVVYLLDRGAILDSNTFEGERCYYAALTDEIEHILRNYKAKPTINPLTEKLKMAFKSGLFSDVTFQFPQTTRNFNLHKFILSVKCGYFQEMFQDRWLFRRSIPLKNTKLTDEAFRALAEYLYTNTLNISIEDADSLKLLCRQCKLFDLESLVDQEYETATRRALGRIIIDNNIYASQENFASADNLAYDLWTSARRIFESTIPEEVQLEIAQRELFTDICLLVENKRFYTHRVLLCAQSEYFKSMLCGSFREGNAEQGEINIPGISASTFYYVMEFIYSNFVQEIEQEEVLDLLSVSDQLLMQSLKNLCARQIIKFVDMENVVDFLQVADLYNSVRLREYCEDFIEENLDEMMHSEDLKQYLDGNGSSVPLLKEKIKDKLDS